MELGSLKINENGRYFEEKGKPFFWLGDTGWLLFSRLDKKDAEHYLETRCRQGYNVIQVSAVHGLPVKNIYGQEPFLNNNVADPRLHDDLNPQGYWEHADEIISLAEQKGIYIAIVPIWALVKRGRISTGQAQAYGAWLGRRFKNRPNIIWLIGGDVRGDAYPEVWDALAKSIKAADPNHLMTFHPFGRTQSSTWFQNRSWLDFNMFQSGHRYYGQAGKAGDDTQHWGPDCWRYVEVDLQQKPAKPTLDGEPSYEGVPHGLHFPDQPWWGPEDARRYAYWSVFAGSAGHTYGHGSVMQMHKNNTGGYGVHKTWQESLFAPGGQHMRYLKALMLSYPYWQRIPDQSALAEEPKPEYERIAVTRGKDYLLAYIFTGRKFSLRLGIIEGTQVRALWFDPRSGSRKEFAVLENQGVAEFTPPDGCGQGNDWVLILESLLK